ncbi:ATPase associated with various cellular activities, AAA_3 (fragment) [groundwater metagenome]|uniref:ATPase associated with various cellular activities, AAA_3 n=1 Tax=groundwater metagenome TaxID=717931 RepID=A0A098E9Z5_9ZZZZ
MDTTLGKIYKIMDALRETKIHMGDDNFSIENFKTNGHQLFTIANSCLRNRMLLLYGGMGANKTTLINVIGSRLRNVPYGDMVSTMIAGHPEQTEEKMIGFMDPRQWMSKYEDGDSIKVMWTNVGKKQMEGYR